MVTVGSKRGEVLVRFGVTLKYSKLVALPTNVRYTSEEYRGLPFWPGAAPHVRLAFRRIMQKGFE